MTRMFLLIPVLAVLPLTAEPSLAQQTDETKNGCNLTLLDAVREAVAKGNYERADKLLLECENKPVDPNVKLLDAAAEALAKNHYDRAEALLHEWERAGKPIDPDSIGACGFGRQYNQLKDLIRAARGCQQRAPVPRRHWRNLKQAQGEVIRLLPQGQEAEQAFADYLECFPVNLTVTEAYCDFDGWLYEGRGLSKFLAYLRDNPGVLENVEWEEKRGDPSALHWVLYPKDPKLYNWSQCDVTPRSGIVALSRDRAGHIFLSGYAIPCKSP